MTSKTLATNLPKSLQKDSKIMYVEENTDYYAETVTEPINKTS